MHRHRRRGWKHGGMLLCAALILSILRHPVASAQQSLGVDPSGRSGDRPPRLLEEQPLSPPPQWVLPPQPFRGVKFSLHVS